jgi:hypothetical protein
MLRYVYYVSSCALAVFLAATQAQAGYCTDHAVVVQRLEQIYGERRQTALSGPDDMTVEVFAAIDTGSWTITVTDTGGLTCLVAAGQGFGWQHHLPATLPRDT